MGLERLGDDLHGNSAPSMAAPQFSQEPIEILKEQDYELQYKGLESTLKLADKQRGGIFGTGREDDPVPQSRNTLR
ncbi:hypothetical protein GCM10009825_12300 [Arthrobacter humicola]|uniref:Uncharacterized protein n=1 Tax=Arthrobacter humicola TaxID=409291 RepID=A0ABP5KEF1_9MICC